MLSFYVSLAVLHGASLGNWINFGSALGTDKTLQVNTTYYILIASHASYDFHAKVTLHDDMDNEGDTGELADYVVENTTKYAGLENCYDVDVFQFDAKGTYTLTIDGEKKLDVSIYSDITLKDSVFHLSWGPNDRPQDVSKYLKAGNTYYLVIKYCGEESSDSKNNTSYLKKVLKSAYFITNMGSKVSGRETLIYVSTWDVGAEQGEGW